MKFVPQLKTIGWLSQYSTEQIKNEPNITRCNYSYAKEYGGLITQEFLSHLDPDQDWIFEIRTHYLKRGQLPSIDAWHLDFWDMNVSREESTVIMALAGSCSLTEFITTPTEISDLDCYMYGLKFDPAKFNMIVSESEKQTRKMEDREILQFSAWDFHRATPATEDGWRVFLRACIRHPSLSLMNKTLPYVFIWEKGQTEILDREIVMSEDLRKIG